MGLIPASEVPPITFAVGAQTVSLESEGEIFRAQEIRTITIDDIIASNGPRRPAFGEAPTEYNVAFIVLSPTPLSDEDFDHFARTIDYFTRPEDITLFDIFGSLEQISNLFDFDYIDPDSPLGQQLLQGYVEEGMFNFYRATGGRGRLHLLKPNELQR